jgi:hypothetical protein
MYREIHTWVDAPAEFQVGRLKGPGCPDLRVA